jgi:hypothetical protein
MKKNIFLFCAALLCFSCVKDLNRFPINDITSEDVYASLDGYKQVLAKVYGSYATIGNNTTWDDDVPVGGDGALTDFIRCWFNLQCLTTEEACYTWADEGCPDLNFMSWTSTNQFVAGLYYRSMYQITLVNEFLRESTSDKLEERGINGSEAAEIECFRNEVRFLRAFQYWVLMDMIGNPPFVDESTSIGKYLPEQKSRQEIFNYIEQELLAIIDGLKAPRTNEYGRADKAAVYALLSRMYLNAEVYTGAPRYTDAITYSNKVIEAGYTLHNDYTHLFLADNDKNNPEVILSINYDGLRTQGYGGLTYIINSSFKPHRNDDTVNYNEYYGLYGQGGWYAFRARKQLTEKFDLSDARRLFIGNKEDIDNTAEFEDGLMGAKFRNVTSDGRIGSNPDAMFVDNDFPLFRLAEIYLIYAEAIKRGGVGGDEAAALGYLNMLRERADLTPVADYDLNYILDERARELWWECFRRTDLVRYGRYTSNSYVWQWKGGVKEGSGVSEHLNLFPLPSSDLIANPNLKQNTGY